MDIMGRSITRSLIRDSQGAIAPIYALAAVGLITAGGIAFDAGRMMAMDTELQNAADQAALAAATQLDRKSGAITNAVNAARGGLVTNFTLFANDGGARSVDAPDASIYFYATQADAEGDTNRIVRTATNADSQAAYVRVVVASRTARFALTPIVGAFSPTINAGALAGMGSALCRTPPVMICNPAESDATSDPDFNANNYIGFGLKATGGGGSAWAPGNYGYLQVGAATNGAPGVRQALGWTTPPGNCISQNGVDTVDTEPGNMTSVTQALNTRFDIYDNQACESGGSCPASINSRKDLVRPNNASGNNACKIHNNGWQEVASAERYLPSSNAALPTTTTPTSMGFPRDICHAVASGGCTGQAFGNGTWDRDAYFRSHYLRPDNTRWSASDWQTYTGLGANATRYQVYKWEIDHRGQVFGNVTVLGQSPATATGSTLVNYGTPVCSSGQGYGTGTVPSTTAADRRRMSVAVVNCRKNSVRGNSTDVPVKRWIDVFLVQPSAARDRTSADEIYVEIIGETSTGSDGEVAGAVIRRDVPYLIR